uniref:phosphatidylinositol-3,4,5-trisphosphate 3-phosphatase n=1 Tax=Bionectria ochroleuca TaxID=29856 RepID=A0A8H7N3Y3_BIOOC
MASMKNWFRGGDLNDESPAKSAAKDQQGLAVESNDKATTATTTSSAPATGDGSLEDRKNKRVVVVHCKAGKGRSGTATCSYLISEEGWDPEDALTRFTQRRMRPQFGAGVSIPSQLRWITYVDRWTRGGKKYYDRPIEIVEVHVWGLRNGVKVDIEGFENEGKDIHVFHTFSRDERLVVEGNAPDGYGWTDMMWELAGYSMDPKSQDSVEAQLQQASNSGKKNGAAQKEEQSATSGDVPGEHHHHHNPRHAAKRTATLIKIASDTSLRKLGKDKESKINTGPKRPRSLRKNSSSSSSSSSSEEDEEEPGGMAVILKPKTPVIIPNSDVNISVERRNRTRRSLGMTMVTAVGHVWFNTFFEGSGPEQENRPNESGVFSIKWDEMDGIKGTSRKGTRALDRLAVVWKFADTPNTPGISGPLGEEVVEPAEGTPVPQTKPADWKGANAPSQNVERNLGLRMQSPASADVSKASSVVSADLHATQATDTAGAGGGAKEKRADDEDEEDSKSLVGVKSSGPGGGTLSDDENTAKAQEKEEKPVAPALAVLQNPDRADGTTQQGSTEVVESKK